MRIKIKCQPNMVKTGEKREDFRRDLVGKGVGVFTFMRIWVDTKKMDRKGQPGVKRGENKTRRHRARRQERRDTERNSVEWNGEILKWGENKTEGQEERKGHKEDGKKATTKEGLEMGRE